MKQYSKVLTIAGSDSGGGAGIQADIKTITALKCFATTAITAITSQNTLGVQSVLPLLPQFIANQINSVLEDIGTDTVKIGMLFSKEIIQTVHERLIHFKIKNIVLDPVMIATAGAKLINDNAVDAVKELLIPISLLVTPNVSEAEAILGSSLKTDLEVEAACKAISDMGAKNVLIKGGDVEGEKNARDCLLHNGVFTWLVRPKVQTINTHGTGCTLSSAICCFLAKGESIVRAVELGKEYTYNAILKGSEYKIGNGYGSTCHF